jgi:hypothetical protein
MYQYKNYLTNFYNKHQDLSNFFLMVLVTIVVSYNSLGTSFSEVDDFSPNAQKLNSSLINYYN